MKNAVSELETAHRHVVSCADIIQAWLENRLTPLRYAVLARRGDKLPSRLNKSLR